MKVELSTDAFTDDGLELIATLIRYFSEGRHDWVVDVRQLPIVEGFFREHIPKRAGVWSHLARKGMVSQAWTAEPSRRDGVTVTQESLRDHVDDLGQAARFVVENGEGDGAFVRAIAHVLADDRIVEAEERGWLKVVQGGGSGEVPKVAQKERKDFKLTFRVMFLLDSDCMTPDSTSKHEAAADDLRDDGIDGHILRFREVENYVPNRVLAALPVPRPRRPALDDRIGHLKKLDQEQRAHFDMKNGFSDRKKKRVEIPAEQQELYRSLPEHSQVGLREGFGDGLTQILLRESKAGKLTESDFDALGPAVCDELRTILDLLHRIL